MSLMKVARPYALAAFEVAHKAKKLSEWTDELKKAATLFEDNKTVMAILNPKLDDDQQFELLDTLFELKDKKIKNFFHLVVVNNRIEALPWIYKDFMEFRAAYEKTLDADVISAFPLSNEEEKQIAEKLEQRLHRKINIENEIDESILGGAIIYAGDLVIDGSALGRLKQLDKTLKGDQL